MTTFDDGDGEDLYAAGTFLTTGGTITYGIARWDGTQWSALQDTTGPGVQSG